MIQQIIERASDVATPWPLVSVIVPCYDAEATVEETLRSVAAQTYDKIEVIIVDDGSRDSTVAKVEAFIAADPRFRLIRQANGGVAAARNTALAEARGTYCAPIDADDIWHPSKLAAQVDAATVAPERIGLVYTWYALIDAGSRITSLHHRPEFEGEVLERICRENFLGNGSSALIRTDLLRRCGGFDASLRARGGQGCEDWRIGIDIAMHAEFRVVRQFLTGYRQTPGNMSSDTMQMFRSADLVASDIIKSRPDLTDVLGKHLEDLAFYLAVRALSLGRMDSALFLLRKCLAWDAARTLARLPSVPLQVLRERAPQWAKQQVNRLKAIWGARRVRASFYEVRAGRATDRGPDGKMTRRPALTSAAKRS